MKPITIHFLTHMARSGSTLLAGELDRYEGVTVGLEESLPDGITRGEKVALHSTKEVDDFLEEAWRDPKFGAWKLDKQVLRARLTQNRSFPVSFRDVLTEMAGLYAGDNHCACFIHKKGPYYLHIDRVRQEFPHARIIHIDRDPRAIYSSQKKALRSDGSRMMAEPITTFAFQYLESQKQISKYRNTPYFHVVAYENLVRHPQRELERIVGFIGCREAGQASAGNYGQNIPQEQRHLHTNLSEDMKMERINAWEHELSADEIFFLQKALSGMIRRNGYGFKEVGFEELSDQAGTAVRLLMFRLKKMARDILPWPYRMIKKIAGKGVVKPQ